MNKKRLDYLDMVKGFGIFLVVLGHMEDISTVTRVWISSVHMPLFFIVTGILMAVKNEPDRFELKEIVYKRYRGVIIPYLWFSLSYFIIDIANCWIIKNIDFRTFIVDTVSSVTFYGQSVLWFLPAMFLSSVGFVILKKKLPDKITVVLIYIFAIFAYVIKNLLAKVYDSYADSLLITSMINVVYIFLRAIIAQSFIGSGYFAKKVCDKITGVCDGADRQDNGRENIAAKLFLKPYSFILGILLLAVNIPVSMRNECADLRNILLNNIALYYVAALSGCFGIILIIKSLPAIKSITYFGRNSIIIMAAHVNYYFLYAGIRLAWVVDSVNKHAKHYVFIAVVIVTVFVLCTVVIEVINRWFPFVLGKKKPENKRVTKDN